MSSSAKVRVGEAAVPVTAEPVVLMKYNRFPYFLQENTHADPRMGNIENLYFHAAKTMAAHSSSLAWKIPWMGAWTVAVHGVGKSRTWLSDFTFTLHVHALEMEMATQSSVLAWRIPGTVEPGGLPSIRSHEVGHNWSDTAAAAVAAATSMKEDSDWDFDTGNTWFSVFHGGNLFPLYMFEK